MTKFKFVSALVLLAAAAGLALIGQPSAAERLAKAQPLLEARLAAQDARLDPGELFDLLQNNQLRLLLIDVRSEADYNLFHIADARRIELAELAQPWPAAQSPETVIVVMSNDELAAEQGWMLLTAQGVGNAYILGGGINFWLTLYRDGLVQTPLPDRHGGDDNLRHAFSSALGARQAAAHPDPVHTPKRVYTTKVKLAGAGKKPGGGCG